MRVNRIDHVNLRTPLLEESVAFYINLLNLRRGPAAGMDETRNAWLYDDQDQPIIHINMPDEGEQVASSKGTGRLHHIAFDCEGHDELITRLGKLGYAYGTNLIAQIGLRQIFLPDPNGVQIELNFRRGK